MKRTTLLIEIIVLSFCPILLWAQKSDYRFGKVTQEELSQKVYPKDSSANAAVLYNTCHVYYTYDNISSSSSRGFVMVREYKRRVKIYKREGFDEADFSIRLTREGGFGDRLDYLNAYTFNLVNGKQEKVKLDKNSIVKERITDARTRIRVAMPAVKEGSVIDIEYNISTDYLGDIPNWYFQEEIPTVFSQCVVEIPEYLEFAREMKGYYRVNYEKLEGKSNTIKSETRDSFNDLSYVSSDDRYTMEDVPAFKGEVFLDSKYNYLSGVVFELKGVHFPRAFVHEYATSWGRIVGMLLNSEAFGNQLNSTGFYEDDLKQALAGSSKGSEKDKIVAVASFLRSKVKWNDYYSIFASQSLRSVYKSGTGNSGEINLLLVSMLRKAGFHAYPVVMSTRSNGFLSIARPSIDALNSVVALVKVDSLSILMDATSPASYPNVLPLEYTNSYGQVVDEAEHEWINLVPAVSSVERTFTQIDFDGKGQLQNQSVISMGGNMAEVFREKNWNNETQKISEDLQKKEGCSFASYTVENLKTSLDKPVIEKVSVDLNGKGKIGDQVLYIDPFLVNRQKESPFKTQERTYPVDFGFPQEEVYTSRIAIPQGYKADGLPVNEHIVVNGIALYDVNYTLADDFILVSSRLLLPQPLVPGDRYGELKDLFAKVVQKEHEQIVLKKI